LKKSRNKLFAHNDKKFNFNSKKKIGKSKIKYEDIERFIDLILEDINVLYRSLTGSTYAFSYYELDEINYISNLIEKDSHKYDNLKYKTPKKP
jgi:predicted glutamine amidotransferase